MVTSRWALRWVLRRRRRRVPPPAAHRPLAAIRPKLDREVVGRLGDDGNWPRQLTPVVGQVRQQFHHGAAAGTGGGHRFNTRASLGKPGLVLVDEPAQLPVTTDL